MAEVVRLRAALEERAIGDTEVRYRLAAKATNDAVWDWDLDSDHVLWNDALEQAYGHPLASIECTGDWWLAHIHPDDRGRIDASIHAVLDGGQTAWNDEYRFRRVDGSYAEILDRGHVIRDEHGRAVRMIGAMLDLTRVRAAEAALRQSEERFSAILQTIEAAFAIVQVKFDADDRPVDYQFVEVNPAFERQTGVDLHGKWVTEFAPELERFWFDAYGHVAKTGEPASFESYAQAFGRWFDVRAVRVGAPADRRIAILFNDVTQRHDAEDRLRVSESLARENVQRVQLALAAGAIIGTWNWDLRTDRFTVDEGFARGFGLDPALGRERLSLEQIITSVHPEDRPGLIAAIDEVIARGGAYAHQYRVRRADGRYYWIEANGRVDHSPEGIALSFPGVLIDVEDRRSIEAERDRATAALRALNDTLELRVAERTAELIHAEEKLRQSQKMEAVGQLTGGLAHDFNNLLAGISGALDLMGMRISQGRLNDIDKYMLAAQSAAKRAAALTHRLLAFSRRQTLDPRPLDVNLLVEGMTELIQRTVGPSILVETVSAPDLWPASVDASQLENAILNLCINSRDAMPDGGRIIIETANQWLDAEAALANDLPAGEYLSLTVTDTGTGMAPGVIAKAFDPFFTTKEIGKGSGLGLAQVYGFARQSGGTVWIESECGRGTSVIMLLPRSARVPEQPAEDERAADDAADPSLGSVLLVDDDEEVAALVGEMLEHLGYRVSHADSATAALNALANGCKVDVVFSDVMMPGGMNGVELAREIRVRALGVPVLLTSGYAEAAQQSAAAEGVHVLAKPYRLEDLAASLHDAIEGAKDV